MKHLDSARLRLYAPFLLPVVIVAIGWALLVRPVSAESGRIRGELAQQRARVQSVRSQVGAPLPSARPVGDPIAAFERRVAVGDASGRLLQELSRLGASTGVRPETIEMGDQQPAPAAGSPGVAGGALPDPRLALFPLPLAYSPVVITAESEYASLGGFLWKLRDLATVVEVRKVEIGAPADAEASGPGVVRATITLFAYARARDGQPVPAAGSGGAGR